MTQQESITEQEPRGELEQWTYLGQSPTGSCWWRDASGADLAYTKMRGRIVGGSYEFRVIREDDKIRVVVDSMRYLGPSRAEDLAFIQTRALGWEAKRASQSLERRTARMAEIDEALEPILALAAGLKEYAHRKALVDYVTDKLLRASR